MELVLGVFYAIGEFTAAIAMSAWAKLRGEHNQ